MKRNEEVPATPQTVAYRPPYLAALIATALVWALYALTLAPSTAFWDTSEYIATAHILGIPHPPGNPLFVVLARAWEVLLSPLGLPVAVRINLFSATMSALAHGFWFLLAHRILSDFSANRVFRLVGASCAVLVSATAFTVWNQSNVNEKVYTVSLFTIALLSWLAFRWRDHLGEGKDDNLILLMVFILALSIGNHLMALLAAPALIAFILWVQPRLLPVIGLIVILALLVLKPLWGVVAAVVGVGIVLWLAPRILSDWRLYAAVLAAIAVMVLGLSIHMYLPLRAGLDPIINQADPTCPTLGSALQSIITMGKSGCHYLAESLSRTQYQKPPVLVNPIYFPQQEIPRSIGLLSAQITNYLQYFDWQWARSISGNNGFFGGIRPLFTLLFVALGTYGSLQHYRRDKKSWAYVAILFLTLSVGLTFYLNFKYGYTFPGHGPEEKEVRERDYFFIVSFSIWGLWAGIGITELWQWIGEKFLRVTRADIDLPPLAASPILALALVPLLLNWSWASRRHDYSARDWAFNLLNSVEPYGVLFTNGDNDTFPLWYAQDVEGIRRDVTVIVMSYLNTDWYVRQLRDLTAPCKPGQNPAAEPTRIICQRPFDVQRGPKVYSNMMADGSNRPGHRAPTRSILEGVTDSVIDQVATTFYQLPEDQTFRVSNIQTVVPRGTFMTPADLFMGLIIERGLDDRPIYFASTTQAFESLQLRPFLIRQGVAFKLNNGPVQADPARGIFALPDDELRGWAGEWIDLPRTELLLSSVFIHRSGLPGWNQWVDVATQNIPYYYFITHLIASRVYASLGDTANMARHAQLSARWNELANK
jgi:transmembrane protein TMEM260 (protein O-mannosyltransferase)